MQTLNNEFPAMPIDIIQLLATLTEIKRPTKDATLTLNGHSYTIIPLKKLVKEIVKTTSAPQMDIQSYQHSNGDLTFTTTGTGRAHFNYRVHSKIVRKILATHGNSFGDKLVIMSEGGKYYSYSFLEGEHHEMTSRHANLWNEISYQQATQLIIRGFNALRVVK